MRPIDVVSRDNDADEISGMKKALHNLPGEFAEAVNSIFCDSRAGYCFTIDVRFVPMGFIDMIESCIIEAFGGHNGIEIKAPPISIDPYWPGDFDNVYSINGKE